MAARIAQILERCLVNEGNVAIPQINVSGQFSNDNCHVRELQYGQAISNVLAWAKQVPEKCHDGHEWRISDQMKADYGKAHSQAGDNIRTCVFKSVFI